MVVMISTFVGGKTFGYVADVASESIPFWLKDALGPLGALVFMGVTIKWLLDRQAKLEKKIDDREAERDADRKTLILTLENSNELNNRNNDLIAKNNVLINTNNKVLEKVNETLSKK